MGTNVGAVVEPPPHPHPTPPQQPCPIPFSLSPCEPRLFWQNQLAELIFKKKKPRQNWSRDHFEATQKANFSILKPNFWSGDTAMGMAHWHNPKRVNFFSNILQNHYFVRWNSYFYQHFYGWLFFANFQTRISYFFTMGLSPCTAWVGDRYIGEVISPFRTLPWQKMTAQFQFFQSLPHKKADFVKKSRQNMGYYVFFYSNQDCPHYWFCQLWPRTGQMNINSTWNMLWAKSPMVACCPPWDSLAFLNAAFGFTISLINSST